MFIRRGMILLLPFASLESVALGSAPWAIERVFLPTVFFTMAMFAKVRALYFTLLGWGFGTSTFPFLRASTLSTGKGCL